MIKIRKRVFAAVLAAALFFTMPGMAFAAQTEDISESVAEQENADGTEQTVADDTEDSEDQTETIQEPEAEDGDTDQPGTGEDDIEDTATEEQEPAEGGQELTTDEQEQSDISPCMELQEQLDEANEPASIDESTEGAVAVVDSASGITYYGDIDTAWTAAQGKTATVNLLADVTAGGTLTVDAGSTITLKGGDYTLTSGQGTAIQVNGTLKLESGTVQSTYSSSQAKGINVSGTLEMTGGAVTASNSYMSGSMAVRADSGGTITVSGGRISGIYGISVNGGTVTINDGEVSGRYAVDVNVGTVTIKGGTFTGSLYYGLNVGQNGTAVLRGGTFTGNVYAINSKTALSDLLDQTQQPGAYYAYFDNGKPVALADGQTSLPGGTYTVGECTHTGEGVCKYQPLDDGTSHTKTCLACGMTWDAESHTDTDHNNQCDDCKTQLVVKLGDVYYDSFDAAWEETNTYDKTSTITLLADVTVGSLTLDAGNITIDGGEYILTTEEILVRSSSSLTIASGTIKGKTYAVTLNGGNLEVTGGRIEADGYGIYIYRGTAKLSGGTITGGTYAIIDSSGGKVGNVLLNYGDTNAGTHYAFYKDNKPFTLPNTDTLPRGTYTVQECKEPCTYSHTSGTMKHNQSCQYCGDTKAEADCSFTWTDNTGTGVCDCSATLVVDVSDTDLIYDGKAKEPGVTVTLDGTKLDTNKYTVTYSGNINAGEKKAAVSVTIGSNQGTYTQTFTIKPATPTITWSENTQTLTYTGKQAEVTPPDVTLVNGESFDKTISYSYKKQDQTTYTDGLPTDAGVYTVKAHMDADGNYTAADSTNELTLTINKADAVITVGTEEYSKTYGDPAFILDAVSDNPEAAVQYEVTDGTDVVTVSEDGTAAIQNAGEAVITVSLPESGNYHAAESKTITVKVAQKEADTVKELNRSYLYSVENTDSIDLSALLPADCGNVTYENPRTSGAVAYSTQPAVDANGKLTYTLQSGSADAEGIITVTVKTRNYTDISFAVKVKLTDKRNVRLKAGKEVELKKSTLTYGEALSKLTFKSATFVDNAGKTVKGTLAWKDAAFVPDAGTASALWVFTPSAGQYAPVEGLAAITVNRAVPTVSAVPTVAERVYNPSIALKDIALSGGAVTGVGGTTLEGIWGWRYVNVAPTVDNGGYEAVFTPEDATNYETVAGAVSVAVTKAVPYIAVTPTAGDITYGDTLNKSGLSAGTVLYGDGTGQSGSGAGSNVPVAGTFTWEEPFARPVAADSDQTEYTVVFKPSDTVNYTTAKSKITLVVDKMQNAPGMPESTMEVPNVIKTVGGVSLPENWQWREEDRNKPLEAGKTVSAEAVYTGTDKGNYETETVTVAITGLPVPDGLWISGLTPSVSYTGSAVKPAVKVYHENTLLREKTDYTISYKNNTKAGTAQVVVTGKGSYKGKATAEFTIEAVDLRMDHNISAIIASVTESGKNLKPTVTVTWSGKKLKEKTDYTLSYEANIKTASTEGYDITITGKGNYTGAIVKKFYVAPKGTPLLNKATVKGLAKSYPYRENRIPEGLEAALENLTVKVGKTTLAKGDYTVRLENVSAVGTGTVVIEAAPGSMYAGQKRVTFNITGASLKNGSIIGLEKTYSYTGSPVEPRIRVYSGKKGAGEQIPSDSYTVSYSNSVGNGKAKVTVTGIAAKGYSGSLSATYTIGKLSIAADGVTVEISDTIEYAKGGAKPLPVITHTHDGKADILREGVDYTLKYSNNTSAVGTKKPTVKITGTGNYSGTVTREYEITGQDIGRLTITAADKAYNSKKKGSYYYSAPKVYDLDGKLLKSGTDYTVQYFDAFTGQEIGKNDAVTQGAEIRVTVTGKGSYRGTLSGTYRVLATGDVKDISKVKNDKIANQPYTGAGIRPEIKLYTMTGKIRTDLNADTDYEIIGFNNNIKKGTATVLIRGKGAYSGVKSITFKIVAVDNGSIWKGVF